MLRRFLPRIVIALLVLASLSVFVPPELTSDSAPCAELFAPSWTDKIYYLASQFYYRAAKTFEAPPTPLTKKNHCDSLVEMSDAEKADISRFERTKYKDRCAQAFSLELDWLKGRRAETLQRRIEVCDAAALDPSAVVEATRVQIVFEQASRPKESDDGRVSAWTEADYEFCKDVTLAVRHNVPPDRAYEAFESHHTKKNYCKLLVEFSNSERGIIDRFDNTKIDCPGRDLDTLKHQYAKTSERRTKACDAAAVDPDGFVTSYSK